MSHPKRNILIGRGWFVVEPLAPHTVLHARQEEQFFRFAEQGVSSFGAELEEVFGLQDTEVVDFGVRLAFDTGGGKVAGGIGVRTWNGA